ncbi:MAG: S1/P1 nuclease [Dechloromonas sp.]|nr:S1/P1 nuclease [Dechloromonas sp.]
MRPYLIALLFLLFSPLAGAWNAAGHRLVAVIAWQQLSPASRDFVAQALGRHPDHARWVGKARSAEPARIFAEAATWPDDIRNDPRFHDDGENDPTSPLPGFPDSARHKNWHYVDVDHQGRAVIGEVDRQIERLTRLLRLTAKDDEISYALPWLVHLVGDIHQPLHVGSTDDKGGTTVEIENPFNKRLTFPSLHIYWDDLPGPPWLRGQKLEDKARRLIAEYPAPRQGAVALWRDESNRLLASAYPDAAGSLLPIATEDFNRRAHAIAERRIVDAGYRLGRLLEASISARVSRETQ